MSRSSSPATLSIDPATTLGPVSLTVSDLARSRTFYEQVIGLVPLSDSGTTTAMGAGGSPLVALHGDPNAPALDRSVTGLFHLAILVPSRRDLAHVIARIAQARWPLDGASDHLVSEALYLSDPDGNGIEIYRDRPREEWRRAETGELAMATLPLDLDSILADAAGDAAVETAMPTRTRIGHVHLQVSDLARAEGFYHGILGFDVMVRSYPGALFVAAGGYHHHLGLNTWHSRGAGAAPEGAVGLRAYEIVLSSTEALADVVRRLDSAGIAHTETGGGCFTRDPFGIGIILRPAAPAT